MDLATAFGEIAVAFSGALGGPYHAGLAKWPGVPVMDEGGSIVTPGTPEEHACMVQVDAADERMRAQEGYVDGDMRLLILADVARSIDTDATISITAGPYTGSDWMVASVARDPVAAYFECRGRRA